MNSYRLTVFDNLPRTGLPPRMADWSEFEGTVQTLVDLELIEDASKIWWDLRPSSHFPTIESRICDVTPDIEVTLTLAALTQSLTRMLWRRSMDGNDWPVPQNFMVAENRWRAQRYGVNEGLIDFGRKALIPFAQAVDEIIELVTEDAETLGCLSEVQAARKIVKTGSSADQQRQTYQAAKQDGASDPEALRAVVAKLVAEFSPD